MPRFRCSLMAIVLAMAAVAGTAQAGPQGYQITDIGTMGDPGTRGPAYSRAFGLSGTGQVVGVANDDYSNNYAFSWRNGVMTNLGALTGTSSIAWGVNDSGQVVGYTPGNRHAFSWTDANGDGKKDPGEMVDLGIPVGAEAASANAINNAGQTVGTVYYSERPDQGFLYDGTFHLLGMLPGGYSSQAYAINDSGQVVGASYFSVEAIHHAFLWNDADRDGRSDAGEMHDIGHLGGEVAYAGGINDLGQVVGASAITRFIPNHAFLWTDNDGDWSADAGEMRDLGTLGGEWSVARAINNSGQVIGESTLVVGETLDHAFLWEDGEMHDLNDLIPADSGWELTECYDINEQGQIAGSGWIGGEKHAYLLTAVPEPATLLLLGLGSLALLRGRKA